MAPAKQFSFQQYQKLVIQISIPLHSSFPAWTAVITL